MSRLPMSKRQHWDLLNTEPDSHEFKNIESKVVRNIEDLFGIEINGEIVEQKERSYGIGFDLDAAMYDDSQPPRNVFPDYSKRSRLSYWCTATSIPTTEDKKDFECFSGEFEFRHRFRFIEDVSPVFLNEMREDGVYVAEFSSGGLRMKEVSTSEEYISDISERMEVARNLIDRE